MLGYEGLMRRRDEELLRAPLRGWRRGNCGACTKVMIRETQRITWMGSHQAPHNRWSLCGPHLSARRQYRIEKCRWQRRVIRLMAEGPDSR